MSDIPTSTMPDFDNMSPEELQAQWAALQAGKLNNYAFCQL